MEVKLKELTIRDLVEDYMDHEEVGILGHSGCCTYPMVEFNEVLFEEHDE